MNNQYPIGIGILIILVLVGFFVWNNSKNIDQNTPSKSSKSQIKPLPREVTVLS